MTALAYPLKRNRRTQSSSPRTRDERQLVIGLTDWEPLHALARTLPSHEDGTVGRPMHFPPVAVLLYATAAWLLHGERAVERAFQEDRALWHSVRRRLLARYPGYAGLQHHGFPMRRHHFRYYRDRYGIQPEIFEQLQEQFRVHSCELARSCGLFDRARGSTTHPAVENVIVGDGTTFTPRLKAVPGELQLDRHTGDLVARRYDPDAYVVTVTDPVTGEERQGPRGIAFGIVSASVPDIDNERVILDTYAIRPGERTNEAALGIDSLRRLSPLLPGAQAVAWDMCMRGTHKDQMLDLGLIPLVKTPNAPGGGPKTQQLGPARFTKRDNTQSLLPLWAVAGAAGITTIVAGNETFVPLIRTRTMIRPGRWYNEYRIPETPEVDPELRGARTRVRQDTSAADRKRHLNRAEALALIPTIDPDWDRLYVRNNAESVNAMIKRRWWNDLAPAIGRPRQHFALLGAALMINYRSAVNHKQRTQRAKAPPAPARTPGSGKRRIAA